MNFNSHSWLDQQSAPAFKFGKYQTGTNLIKRHIIYGKRYVLRIKIVSEFDAGECSAKHKILLIK
jgi:hypothetical protein